MRIEAISKEAFDNVDQEVKRCFNGTISRKIPLKNLGDWYREIDVSDDAKILFLRTANQCMPLPFKNISSIITGMSKQKVGEEIQVSSGNNWGLTGAAAAFGWLAISHRTQFHVVDNYAYMYYVRILLAGHPTDNEAIFLCNDRQESVEIVQTLRKIVEERKQDAQFYSEPNRLSSVVEQKMQGKKIDVLAEEEKNKQLGKNLLILLIISFSFLFLVLIFTS